MSRAGCGEGVAAAVALALLLASSWAPAQERPRTASSVKVPVQGSGEGGVVPEAGAPPAVAPPKAPIGPVSATAAPASRAPQAGAARAPSLRAVSLREGEATLAIEGERQEVVRPGSRLGHDVVRSVTPERIVLERPAEPGAPGGPALVIVSFDEKGAAKERVYWLRDPAQPTEAKRP